MLRKLALATAALSLLPVAALAQVNPTAPPAYGSVALTGKSAADPVVVELLAGGTLLAAAADPLCVGSIASAPDYRVNYTPGGGDALTFSVISEADTTLVVRGPSGAFSCNDDAGGRYNPMVNLDRAPSGTYNVWVGTYGTTNADAVLIVTEHAGPSDFGLAAFGTQPNFTLDPTAGTQTLAANFTPDPFVVSGTIPAGQAIIDSGALPDCFGAAITEAPIFRLQYTAGTDPLIITVESDRDTTLVINNPNGEWTCNDDRSGTNLNPMVTFDTPLSGVYDIWVGTYDPTIDTSGSLRISDGGAAPVAPTVPTTPTTPPTPPVKGAPAGI